MKRILIVVDMQNDFVTGSLGTEEARAIIPNVIEKINQYKNGYIFFTKDVHHGNYMDTLEGQKLPVIHCLYESKGADIVPEIWDVIEKLPRKDKTFISNKSSFGSEVIAFTLQRDCDPEDVIEICGVCTDICVVSNALMLRTILPNNIILVDYSCCAGTSKENHEAALLTMKNCQIDVFDGSSKRGK